MPHHFAISLALLLACSCTSDPSPEADREDVSSPEQDSVQSQVEEADSANHPVAQGLEPGEWTYIDYPDLTISIRNLDATWDGMDYSGDDSVNYTTSDTAYFNLMPGDWMYDKAFLVEQGKYDHVELFEKIIYHVSISTNRTIEVPLCVMNGWKSAETEWIPVTFTEKGTRFPSDEQTEIPTIDYSRYELLIAVAEHCGPEWIDDIYDMPESEFPTDVFTSSYLFRIVATISKTGEKVEKYIVFRTPTSC